MTRALMAGYKLIIAIKRPRILIVRLQSLCILYGAGEGQRGAEHRRLGALSCDQSIRSEEVFASVDVKFRLAFGVSLRAFERLENNKGRNPANISGIQRCFDTVFRRPYRCFSIALKEILSMSDRYKIFASD